MIFFFVIEKNILYFDIMTPAVCDELFHRLQRMIVLPFVARRKAVFGFNRLRATGNIRNFARWFDRQRVLGDYW